MSELPTEIKATSRFATGFILAVLAPAGQEPTPPVNPDGLPVTIWANLPLLVCLVFGIAIGIGLVIIVRKNQQVAREKMAWEQEQNKDREL